MFLECGSAVATKPCSVVIYRIANENKAKEPRKKKKFELSFKLADDYIQLCNKSERENAPVAQPPETIAKNEFSSLKLKDSLNLMKRDKEMPTAVDNDATQKDCSNAESHNQSSKNASDKSHIWKKAFLEDPARVAEASRSVSRGIGAKEGAQNSSAVANPKWLIQNSGFKTSFRTKVDQRRTAEPAVLSEADKKSEYNFDNEAVLGNLKTRQFTSTLRNNTRTDQNGEKVNDYQHKVVFLKQNEPRAPKPERTLTRLKRKWSYHAESSRKRLLDEPQYEIASNKNDQNTGNSTRIILKTRKSTEQENVVQKEDERSKSICTAKGKKISPLTLYSKLDGNTITEVICKRYRKRVKRQSFQAESAETQAQRELAIIETFFNRHESVAQSVRDTVSFLVKEVSMGRVSNSEELSLDVASSQLGDLVYEFCLENGFNYGDFSNLDDLLSFKVTESDSYSDASYESVSVGIKRKPRRRYNISPQDSEEEDSFALLTAIIRSRTKRRSSLRLTDPELVDIKPNVEDLQPVGGDVKLSGRSAYSSDSDTLPAANSEQELSGDDCKKWVPEDISAIATSSKDVVSKILDAVHAKEECDRATHPRVGVKFEFVDVVEENVNISAVESSDVEGPESEITPNSEVNNKRALAASPAIENDYFLNTDIEVDDNFLRTDADNEDSDSDNLVICLESTCPTPVTSKPLVEEGESTVKELPTSKSQFELNASSVAVTAEQADVSVEQINLIACNLQTDVESVTDFSINYEAATESQTKDDETRDGSSKHPKDSMPFLKDLLPKDIEIHPIPTVFQADHQLQVNPTVDQPALFKASRDISITSIHNATKEGDRLETFSPECATTQDQPQSATDNNAVAMPNTGDPNVIDESILRTLLREIPADAVNLPLEDDSTLNQSQDIGEEKEETDTLNPVIINVMSLYQGFSSAKNSVTVHEVSRSPDEVVPAQIVSGDERSKEKERSESPEIIELKKVESSSSKLKRKLNLTKHPNNMNLDEMISSLEKDITNLDRLGREKRRELEIIEKYRKYKTNLLVSLNKSKMMKSDLSNNLPASMVPVASNMTRNVSAGDLSKPVEESEPQVPKLAMKEGLEPIALNQKETCMVRPLVREAVKAMDEQQLGAPRYERVPVDVRPDASSHARSQVPSRSTTTLQPGPIVHSPAPPLTIETSTNPNHLYTGFRKPAAINSSSPLLPTPSPKPVPPSSTKPSPRELRPKCNDGLLSVPVPDRQSNHPAADSKRGFQPYLNHATPTTSSKEQAAKCDSNANLSLARMLINTPAMDFPPYQPNSSSQNVPSDLNKKSQFVAVNSEPWTAGEPCYPTKDKLGAIAQSGMPQQSIPQQAIPQNRVNIKPEILKSSFLSRESSLSELAYNLAISLKEAQACSSVQPPPASTTVTSTPNATSNSIQRHAQDLPCLKLQLQSTPANQYDLFRMAQLQQQLPMWPFLSYLNPGVPNMVPYRYPVPDPRQMEAKVKPPGWDPTKDQNPTGTAAARYTDNNSSQLYKHQQRPNPKQSVTKNLRFRKCMVCNQADAQFICSGCGKDWYCSVECQRENWKVHSRVCSS